ncbi:hypothetical protein HBB16_18580 [Pseudonocardia sp. MCCB 268]|nr:hypothetical protein [Pseudonocardia cytotoxica]
MLANSVRTLRSNLRILAALHRCRSRRVPPAVRSTALPHIRNTSSSSGKPVVAGRCRPGERWSAIRRSGL